MNVLIRHGAWKDVGERCRRDVSAAAGCGFVLGVMARARRVAGWASRRNESRVYGDSPMIACRAKVGAGLWLLGGGGVAGCGGEEFGKGSGQPTPTPVLASLPDEANRLIKDRSLSPDDVTAALTTYMPTGKMDDYVMFASGGHSGQVF